MHYYSVRNAFRVPLPAQILIGVAVGILLGLLFPSGQLKPLSEVGRLVIHWVKLIAGPFLFLAIVSTTMQVQLGMRHAVRVVGIAISNTAIAIVIGLALATFFFHGMHVEPGLFGLKAVETPTLHIGLSGWIKTFTPPSVFHPFVQNEILLIAVMALLCGMALRQILKQDPEGLSRTAVTVEKLRQIPAVFLEWLIGIIPLAVLSVVAGAVSEFGFTVLVSLMRYVGAVLLGFLLRVGLVYGFWLFVVARLPIRRVFRALREPVAYAFGVNSSLATLPLTFKALKDLGVSSTSASLGAGVATNINNDGIVLYEAMAVFFISQLAGISLTEPQMLAASIACIVAAMGITGIPEAGFISLSVVVATLGLPTEALPLLLAVDWMLARGRSVVNVLSDITLSVALDATERERPVPN